MILGAILAGGRSSRFGADKALALWEGRPLIAHAHDLLAQVAERVVICGPSWNGLAGLADHPCPDMGPLGGINAALHHGQARGFEKALTIACDTPLVPAALIARLSRESSAYVADLPVLGIWPTALADDLDRFLGEAGSHAIRAWADRIGALALPADPIPNINRPDDLATLRRTGDPG